MLVASNKSNRKAGTGTIMTKTIATAAIGTKVLAVNNFDAADDGVAFAMGARR